MADLSVFLPWNLFRVAPAALRGEPAFEVCRGTALFCDVAGFTPLTEALSVLGKEGAEELTRLLNAYFTRMIGIIEQEGGDVLRFGGDAMTVFFPGSERPALRAASRMMAAMGEFATLPTRAGAFSLSMKVGAASGPVQMGFLGGEATGRDFYAAGAPLDGSADAEHRARPGHIVCHPSVAEALPPQAEPRWLEGGFALVERPWTEAAAPLGTLRPPVGGEVLRAVVPAYLAERAAPGILGEHRGTAVLFLSFREEGCAADPARRHALLDEAYRTFAATARRYGGLVNKMDMGDKGCKVILLFGTPYAIEQREEMAALAAMELMGSPLAAGGAFRAGLTSSQLFSGPVGSPSRREFTVMGDGINLAARLMQAASPGQVLCDGATARGAKGIRFEALEPIRVKGKRDPVPLFVPVARRDRDEVARAEVPLVEREDLCGVLSRYLFAGEGGPLILAGEAGSGKTALVEWARAGAALRQIPVTRAILAPFSAERPYGAWRGAIRARVGLEKGDSAERAEALREAALAEEPAGYRPLLNLLLGLPEEVTPATKNLSAKERKDLTFAMVARLLRGGGERVILLDNLHWADPLSLDLLAFLLQEVPAAPWRLLASMRPGSEAADSASANMERAEVLPLSPRGVGEILGLAHGLQDPTEAVLAWFSVRSRGNPALVVALVSALETAGLVTRDSRGKGRLDADRLFATAFPETLEGLYMARVDRLPRREREVLQGASILGVSVSFNLLREITSLPDADLASSLEALGEAGLLKPDTWGPRPYWKFAEPLLRDAVYASLPYAVRREGHLRVARELEPAAEGQSALWPVLAHHLGQGGEVGRARTYHRRAGREAVGRFDNLTALRHLEVVCAEITHERETVEDAFSLLDIYTHLGRRENFGDLLGRLLPLEGELPKVQRAQLLLFRARQAWQSQRWEEAEAHLLEGRTLYEEAGDISGVGKCYVNLVGGTYGPTGRLAEARECLEKALALPGGPGQSPWRCLAAMNLGAVKWHLGDADEAEDFFKKAHREAVRGKLGPQKANIADNLCALLGEKGRFSEAGQWGKKAVDLTDTFALRSLGLNARYNYALAVLANGSAGEVRGLLVDVARRAAEFGNKQIHAAACQGLSQACALQGDFRSAIEYADSGLREFDAIQNGRDYGYTLKGITSVFRALDSPGEARAFWEKAGAARFLAELPEATLREVDLARLGHWLGLPAGTTQRGEESCEARPASPEVRLERLLSRSERAMERGDHLESQRLAEEAREAIERWPYVDGRLRLTRLKVLLKGSLSGEDEREARRLLGRCMGGVWGLRLLCELWGRSPSGRGKSTLRSQALRHLYYVHAHSPSWAWEKVVSFPEVRSVLKG